MSMLGLTDLLDEVSGACSYHSPPLLGDLSSSRAIGSLDRSNFYLAFLDRTERIGIGTTERNNHELAKIVSDKFVIEMQAK